jgi:asparagine synthase (glutamine-hydrolysing)
VAREKVTVCLSGDGGDENFAGYRRYRFDVLENRLRSLLPSRISSPVFARLAGIYPKADWLPQIFRAKTLLTNLSYSPEQGYFNTMSWLKPKAKRRLYNETFQRELNGYEPIAIMQEHFARTRGWDALSRIQYVDIKTYLVDDILTKVDRTSMAHALEVRVPILDHQVMEYAAHIPAGYKLRGREEKYIFKKALQAIVPPQIIHRPKRGFSVPLAAWLRKDLKNVFEERVFSPYAWLNNWFEPKALERLWSQHQRGTRDYAHELWALLVLEHWCGKFLAS